MLVVERLIEEVGVVPGHRFDRGDPEVVGHEVDEVDRRLDLGHLGVLEERRRGAGGEGEQQAPVPRRAVGVEGGAQLRHQRGEGPLVLGPMDVAVAAQPRVFPVDVEAVEVVAANEIDRAGTNTRRLSAVSAASEKPPDQVQPPTETSTFRCGWARRTRPGS